MDARERLRVAQQGAVRAVYECGGISSVVNLAEMACNPGDVDVAVALGLDADWAVRSL